MNDSEIILQALYATLHGSFFEEWEFETLIGANKCEVLEIYNNWPKITIDVDKIDVIVANVFNNLLNYPHGKEKELEGYFSVPLVYLERFIQEK